MEIDDLRIFIDGFPLQREHFHFAWAAGVREIKGVAKLRAQMLTHPRPIARVNEAHANVQMPNLRNVRNCKPAARWITQDEAAALDVIELQKAIPPAVRERPAKRPSFLRDARSRELKSSGMLFRKRLLASALQQLSSTLQQQAELIKQLERLHSELRAREVGHAVSRFSAEVGSAAHVALDLGAALECFAAAMRRPLGRGFAGGRARARQLSHLAERWSDGRFIGHADWEQIEREVSEAAYMRHAPGGFARAATALRSTDGTFIKA